MSDLFTSHPEISQASCDSFAEQVVGQPVRPLDWQGCFSYTLESEDERTVVQFRSSDSPLDACTVRLAKTVHSDLVPNMECLGNFENTSVTVWKMDQVPGLGFFYLLSQEDDIKTKLSAMVIDMAK